MDPTTFATQLDPATCTCRQDIPTPLGTSATSRSRGALRRVASTLVAIALLVTGWAAAQSVQIHGVDLNVDHNPDGIWINVDLSVSDVAQTVKVLAWVRNAVTGGYVTNHGGDSDYQDADDDLLISGTQSAGERNDPLWLFLPYDQLPEGSGSYYLQVVVRQDGSTQSLANVVFDQQAFTAVGGTAGTPATSRIVIEEIEQGAVFDDRGEHRPFAFTFGDYDLSAGRIYAEALVTGGIGESPAVTGAIGSWVYADAGRYRLSADLYWSGYLSGAGVAGAGTSVSYVVKVYDSQQRPIASTTVHQREVRESYLTVGGLHDEGTETALLEFEVTDDAGFFVSFELSCEATAGVIAFDVYCLYGSGLTGDHTVLAGYAGVSQAAVERLR